MREDTGEDTGGCGRMRENMGEDTQKEQPAINRPRRPEKSVPGQPGAQAGKSPAVRPAPAVHGTA